MQYFSITNLLTYFCPPTLQRCPVFLARSVHIINYESSSGKGLMNSVSNLPVSNQYLKKNIYIHIYLSSGKMCERKKANFPNFKSAFYSLYFVKIIGYPLYKWSAAHLIDLRQRGSGLQHQFIFLARTEHVVDLVHHSFAVTVHFSK